MSRFAVAAVLLLASLSASLGAVKNPHPNWISYIDLDKFGFECKSIGDGLLHCTNPDAKPPSYVCPVTGGPCAPGEPAPRGTGKLSPPLHGGSLSTSH